MSGQPRQLTGQDQRTLHQAQRLETCCILAGDHEMIVDDDFEGPADFDQCARHFDIGLARRGIAGRVIMDQDDRRSFDGEGALDHFARIYHDADSFHNRPTYDAQSMKTTSGADALFYKQRVGSYVFATQERFATAAADFECAFWPSKEDTSEEAAGLDIVLLVGPASRSSHLLLLTVYDDPGRPGGEHGDTANQHKKLLGAMRRDR